MSFREVCSEFLKGTSTILTNIAWNVSNILIRRSEINKLSSLINYIYIYILLSSNDRPYSSFKIPAASILNGAQCTTSWWCIVVASRCLVTQHSECASCRRHQCRRYFLISWNQSTRRPRKEAEVKKKRKKTILFLEMQILAFAVWTRLGAFANGSQRICLV